MCNDWHKAIKPIIKCNNWYIFSRLMNQMNTAKSVKIEVIRNKGNWQCLLDLTHSILLELITYFDFNITTNFVNYITLAFLDFLIKNITEIPQKAIAYRTQSINFINSKVTLNKLWKSSEWIKLGINWKNKRLNTKSRLKSPFYWLKLFYF